MAFLSDLPLGVSPRTALLIKKPIAAAEGPLRGTSCSCRLDEVAPLRTKLAFAVELERLAPDLIDATMRSSRLMLFFISISVLDYAQDRESIC
jgi:hypothetical protein